jgi:hypothetical protein
MATKLTKPQVAALQYYAAVKDGCPSARMKERGLKFPAQRTSDKLLCLGLLKWVKATRFDYLLKQDVPIYVRTISPAGIKALGVDQEF